MKKVFMGTLLASMALVFFACNSEDDDVTLDDNDKIELTIGSAEPMIFAGTCMKMNDSTYQLTGSAVDDAGLSFTIFWQGEDPKGTFAWDASFESSVAGTWLLMTNGDLSKSYYSYDAADGEVTGNRSGKLVINKFGGVDGLVEGTFEVTNARFLEVKNGQATETSVKLTASFKVTRSI